MKEYFVYGTNLAETYHCSLVGLYNEGEIVACPDYNTNQKEISMTIVTEHPLMEPRISALFAGGPDDLEQYVQEMTDGILDFEVDRGNWKYTYHQRMTSFPVDPNVFKLETPTADQIQFVIEDLKRNPDSRRAVINIRDNSSDMYSADPACLQHMQFFIRNGALHLKALFRSNDACKAAFMNMYALVAIQQKVANALNIPVGSYTHRANSYHCYERDFGLLEGYVKRIKDKDGNITTYFNRDNTYFLNGEWDEMMEEAKPKIAAKVEDLKNRTTTD